MDILRDFLVGYFNVSTDDYELDEMIDDFINDDKKRRIILISELENIIKLGRYKKASEHILKNGMRKMSKKCTEEFIRYIYAKLKNKKHNLTVTEIMNIK
jgi:hypothetical protein